VFEQASPIALIVDAEYWPQIKSSNAVRHLKMLVVRGGESSDFEDKAKDFAAVISENPNPQLSKTTLDELRCISFTSGTTGLPKGALLTERMLITCAVGAAVASDVKRGDAFLLWEPIYHNSGVQMCILALMEDVKLAVIPRFSASRFWDHVRRYNVTKMHYLGGVIDLLLKQLPRSDDREHGVRIAFGGGCRKSSWRPFEERFNVRIREAYGLTEASCFTALNISGKVGSIGKPYPYFKVKIVNNDGLPLESGQIGEILIRENAPGLITKGYLGNPEATANALRNGWLHTGDLGRYDEDGDLYYMGRKKDSIRRRGENISAWEVERELNSHPQIEESAVIGVEADIGEQELKAFIKRLPGSGLTELEIIRWCESRMPYYHLPRYIAFIESFKKTPTERIQKETLPKSIEDCWDIEKSGYKAKRT
jgi:crotonobetaine/carnitine-CoA ligase